MKIRLTSILLAVFMVFGLMLNTGAIFAHDDFPGAVRNNANVPTENAKEVVFLIDRSMYTDYNALADIKNQVSDLSDQLLQAGNFSITVIAFNGNVTTLVRQSTDLNKIKNSLRYISPFGFSNPSLALEVANGIRYEEKKDVVLFTNVYPNLGPISNKGPFTYRDHMYFRNANGFKNSRDSLAENTRLITVSNFSNLKNRDYAFAKRVFEENSDKYYAADRMNNDELVSSVRDYILGDEKHDRNLDKKPIIFIPGIAGSELFKIDESLVSPEEKAIGMVYGDKERSANRIWVPIGYDATKANDDLNLYSNENLYGLQQGDLRKVNVFERHAGPVAMYSSLLGTIMKNFPDRPVYLFSYDWRKSNIDSAEKLAAFIDSITDGGKVKVDLIAHSMGGIVSSHYLREHDDRVDKYLSFGSPYEGAPSAFNTLSSKSLVGGFLDVVIEKLVGIKPDVASSFTSMVELLPTQRMLEKYPYQFVSTGDLNSFQRILNSNSSYDKILQAAADAKVSGLADLATVDMAMSNVSNDRYNQFIEDSMN